MDIFNAFEKLIDKIDPEDLLYLLRDLNCDILHEWTNNHISLILTNIFNIYGLSQLIAEQTRITPNTRTLIDFYTCITNSPEKSSKFYNNNVYCDNFFYIKYGF